jgi:hypothetical protein
MSWPSRSDTVGRLVTLDRGMANLVPSGAAAQSVVLIDA